jgi:hypothetical protein
MLLKNAQTFSTVGAACTILSHTVVLHAQVKGARVSKKKKLTGSESHSPHS